MFLVFVFDGLRPDLLRPEVMPRLCALRDRGTWFERSHCVFPSVTRVNAASLATGSHPRTHGVPANTLFLPDLSPDAPLRTTGDVAVLRLLRGAAEGPLLGAPTLGEVLAEYGLRTVAVGTGSPGSAYLLHPEADASGGAIFHHTFTEPSELAAGVHERLGTPPESGDGYSVEGVCARVGYAARALTSVIMPRYEPALVLFWCTVPDSVHHRFGLGSPEATAGLRAVDETFGTLVDDLKRQGGEAPNVIVTSDHGYATVERILTVEHVLRPLLAGLDRPPIVAIDGGAMHFYSGGGSCGSSRLVERLVEADLTSGVCSRHEAPGAVSLETVMLDTARAADVVACFGWRHGENGRGVGGLSLGGGGIAAGAGDHGGGSPFEMRNTLLASGPAFQHGVSTVPAGIVDVAPTVCRVLGLERPTAWHGRVLLEALQRGGPVSVTTEEVLARPSATGARTVAAIERVAGVGYVSSLSKLS